MDEEKTIFEKLYEANTENFANLVKGLSTQFSGYDVVEKTFQNASHAKETVDQNMGAFLSLLNVPSKADYEQLVEKIEEVQGNLLNINMKLDRLLAEKDKPRRRSPVKSKRKIKKSDE